MHYYRLEHHLVCSFLPDLPFPACPAPQTAPERAIWLYARQPERSRASFAVSDYRQLLQSEESWRWLDGNALTADARSAGKPQALIADLIASRGLKAINYAHPRWQELLTDQPQPKPARLHLLALGDVGGMLLTALRLLGGGQISSIGVHDIEPARMARWEMEMNQIHWPHDYQRLPPVDIISQEQLFDCDMFVFCASLGVPSIGTKLADVRMAQYRANVPLIADYARRARDKGFRGLFAVVSDPVDPLCRAAFLAANRGSRGGYDWRGLLPEQIKGYGLGVMNARAAYFAGRDPRFAAFLEQGRVFGPHGAGLVVANSIADYDDALSRELTNLVVNANLHLRDLGYKPYIAPAVSSGAISLLLTLRGEWQYSSVMLGDIYMGCRNRLLPAGVEIEALPLTPALSARIGRAAEELARLDIEELI